MTTSTHTRRTRAGAVGLLAGALVLSIGVGGPAAGSGAIGVITEFSAGISASVRPYTIAAGPDGNLWFTEATGNAIGRITPTGTVTEFTDGITAVAKLNGIAAGPDGNMWFTEYEGDRVGVITPTGTVTEYSSGIDAGDGRRGSPQARTATCGSPRRTV